MSKIQINGLTKIFGQNEKAGIEQLRQGKSKDEILRDTGATVGVNQASIEIEEGEFFVIMGLSGSGKSTLIRLVNRLIEPTSGEVMIDGSDIAKMSKQNLIETRRKKLGMVFQNFGLFPHKNILDNVAYGLEIQEVPLEERQEKARRSIVDVGLAGYEQSYPKELSGGMQQRVGLARALANDTDILLMDEAFSALDPLIRKDMQDELLGLQNKLGKTILFITHDLDEALKLGDRIAIMKDGEIVQTGTSEDILATPANDYVSEFVKNVDRSKVLEASQVMRKPEVLISTKDGPRMAIRKMEEAGVSSIFVVDKEGRFQGVLTIDDAIQCQEKGAVLENVLITNIYQTAPDTPLADLIGAAVDTKYPIAVVKEGMLLGIISRVSILSGLVLGKEQEEVSNT
ncbi:MAG: glycine betaine/L-proline ABC transporter ATP-binding protein [Alkalicoccus sp.]|nr:MAG: glycine betaine/L-proline ABC transporter ATP-binding protein [Alkalicoccus sp.]